MSAGSEHLDLQYRYEQLAAEATERMRIVEDLANTDPYVSAYQGQCRYCHAFKWRTENGFQDHHADGCLWVRARKAVKR